MKLRMISDEEIIELAYGMTAILEDPPERVVGYLRDITQAQLKADQKVVDEYLKTAFKPDWTMPNLNEMREEVVREIFEEIQLHNKRVETGVENGKRWFKHNDGIWLENEDWQALKQKWGVK